MKDAVPMTNSNHSVIKIGRIGQNKLRPTMAEPRHATHAPAWTTPITTIAPDPYRSRRHRSLCCEHRTHARIARCAGTRGRRYRCASLAARIARYRCGVGQAGEWGTVAGLWSTAVHTGHGCTAVCGHRWRMHGRMWARERRAHRARTDGAGERIGAVCVATTGLACGVRMRPRRAPRSGTRRTRRMVGVCEYGALQSFPSGMAGNVPICATRGDGYMRATSATNAMQAQNAWSGERA